MIPIIGNLILTALYRVIWVLHCRQLRRNLQIQVKVSIQHCFRHCFILELIIRPFVRPPVAEPHCKKSRQAGYAHHKKADHLMWLLKLFHFHLMQL